MALASGFYREHLKASPRAIDYLKRRGLSGEIAARFEERYGGTRRLAGLRFGVLMEEAFITFWDDIAQNPPEP